MAKHGPETDIEMCWWHLFTGLATGETASTWSWFPDRAGCQDSLTEPSIANACNSRLADS